MILDRDAGATDALLTDLYLEALLAGSVLGAEVGPAGFDAADAIDPAARRAAERLRHDLVRVHPSFRFEERLATRLAEAAAAMRVPVAVGSDSRIVPFRAPWLDDGGSAHGGDPSITDLPPINESAGSSASPSAGPDAGPDPAHRPPPRPLLIGGALTSAAISIAGAAFVAWRHGRPGRASTPMARAARAVRDGASGRDPLTASGRRRPVGSVRGLD